MSYKFDCRYFNGYKPCAHKRPCDGCTHYSQVKTRICVVSLEALGAVLRSTVLLEPIRKNTLMPTSRGSPIRRQSLFWIIIP